MQAEARDAFAHLFASAGALAFMHASSESAAPPALSHAFAERKQAWGHWRLQWPKLLRQTFVAWAAESPRHAFWAQVYSQQQRAKGKAHQAAVRALACTWLRILYRCGQERTPYDASVYLQALNRRSAPLLHTLAHEAYKGVKTP